MLFFFSLVCKFKAHKRCAVRATNNCKWTTLASIGKDIIEDEDGVGINLNSSSLNSMWKHWYVLSALYKCHLCLCVLVVWYRQEIQCEKSNQGSKDSLIPRDACCGLGGVEVKLLEA